jgi:hypothetical protein
MFGLFLKAAKPRHAAYGAVVMLVAASTAHWAGVFSETEPTDDILTASITPAAPSEPAVAVPLPVPRPEIALAPKTAPVVGAKRQFTTFDSRDMGGSVLPQIVAQRLAPRTARDQRRADLREGR